MNQIPKDCELRIRSNIKTNLIKTILKTKRIFRIHQILFRGEFRNKLAQRKKVKIILMPPIQLIKF